MIEQRAENGFSGNEGAILRRRRSEYRPLTEAYTAYGDCVRIERIEPGSVCYRHLGGEYRGFCGYADSPCELYLQKEEMRM